MEQALLAIGTLLNGVYLISGLSVTVVFMAMLYIPSYGQYLVEFCEEMKEFYQTKSMAEVLFYGPYAILGYLAMALPWMMGASPIPGLVLTVVYTVVNSLVYVRYLRTYVK